MLVAPPSSVVVARLQGNVVSRADSSHRFGSCLRVGSGADIYSVPAAGHAA
jgi:hypothetical protein